MRSISAPHRFRLHGVPIELQGADLLGFEVDRLLREFQTDSSSPSCASLPILGTLRGYRQSEVLMHLSPLAVRVATPGHGIGTVMELYQDAERFWLVDDRWGMAEINLMKGTWRSWMLENRTLDDERCAELAVLWPLAQLLRGRGLCLLPAVSVERDGRGVLILSPFDMEAELAVLVRKGYRIIGRRWSCLREEAEKIELLPMPGASNPTPCEMVVMIEPSRRPTAHARELSGPYRLDALRRSWPMIELHRARRQFPLKLAASSRCCSIQLTRAPEDLLVLLDSFCDPMPSAAPAPRVSLNRQLIRSRGAGLRPARPTFENAG